MAETNGRSARNSNWNSCPGIGNHLESHANRIDETTAAVVRSYRIEFEFTLAFYREVIPNVAVAALNLI